MAVTTEEAQAVQSVYVNRKYFYGKQSDKYMIQYQLGRITKEEWEAKRQEVKDMLPYPSGIDKTEALDEIVSLTGWTYE